MSETLCLIEYKQEKKLDVEGRKRKRGFQDFSLMEE